MTQTDKAAEAKPEVELRVTWAKQDREFWLHMRLPDGKSAGINLGDPNGMITSAALRACVGHTFSTHPQDAESLRAEVERLRNHSDALEAQCRRDRKRADEAQSDAVMWQYSMASGDHDGQPLLVRVWRQRKEADRRAKKAEAAKSAHKSRGDNHWETMRCIYRIATEEGDMKAIIQHIKDAGSGYTERPEETLRRYQTELATALTDLATARAETAMAFEVAAMGAEDNSEPGMYRSASDAFRSGYEDAAGHIARAIRALTPADATAALAARDKAKDDRISELQAKLHVLTEAAEHLLQNYLRDELDEPDLCVDEGHWNAIHDLNIALQSEVSDDRT